MEILIVLLLVAAVVLMSYIWKELRGIRKLLEVAENEALAEPDPVMGRPVMNPRRS